MDVRCPQCEQTGRFEAPAIAVANDNLIAFETAMGLDVPEGFRVVVFGWRSPYEHLCCVKCGVPAQTLS